MDNSCLPELLSLARKSGATAADTVLIRSTALSQARRLKKPEGLERAESTDIGLRVFVGHKQAIASSSDISPNGLQELAERAVAMAKVATEDNFSTLAPQELLAKTIPSLDLCDKEEPTPEWMKEQCALAEDAALSVPGITNSEGAEAGYSRSEISLATSHGFMGSYQSSHFSISVSVLAGEGTAMERDYEYTSARHRADLRNAAAIGKKAAERTLARLNPRKVSTCKVPVVYDPRVGRGLLANFANAINGASIARGTSFLKDALGKQIFAPQIHVIDDPLRVRGHASRPFDGEGVQVRMLDLVEDGVLKSWLLDSRSANKLGLTTTGHASRGIGGPPTPSSSNLYIAPGNISPKGMLKAIKNGFYVTEVFGMGVNLVTGDYSQGASGLWIDNGELAYAVSELTIAGNLKDMFLALTAADDLEFRYGTNTPTLCIEGMTVAGK